MTDENLRGKPWSPRMLLTVGVIVAVAFLAGFLWQWIEARGARGELDAVRLELTFQELENELASALIQAENGSWESARGLMSGFFTGLQAEVESAPEQARAELRDILGRRDAVITALSRADPASEELLERIYTRYQVAMGGPDAGIPIPAPRGADSVPATPPGDSAPAGG